MPKFTVMHNKHLPGSGTPTRPKSSLMKNMRVRIIGQLRRPTRLRGKFLFVAATVTSLIFLHIERNHASDIHRRASSLGAYFPENLTQAFSHHQKPETMRWDNVLESAIKNKSTNATKRPTFRLLIPASKPNINLCKTLLSAAILNYPPPTLLGYGLEGDRSQPVADIVRGTLKFLWGKGVHEDDLVLVVDENTWFQLPAEITINRFFHNKRMSKSKLLKKHGRLSESLTTLSSHRPQRYTQQVFFAAQKECTGSPYSPACLFAPQSPLSEQGHDPYNLYPSKNKFPRYMVPTMMMGAVADLRPIFEHGTKLVEREAERNASQHIMSQIFRAQQSSRSSYHQSTLGPFSRASQWISGKLGFKQGNLSILYFKMQIEQTNATSPRDCEFGIGLDYSSSIFQTVHNSIEDIRFMNFSISAIPPTKTSHLPIDLEVNSTAPPFCLHLPSTQHPMDLDIHPDITRYIGWAEVNLATNIHNPSLGVVPSTINILSTNSSYSNITTEWWQNMWYHANSTNLLRQYIYSPDGPIAVDERGTNWWGDVRGGKGGAWTHKGEWIGWNEICGPFDGEVFGDMSTVFGNEGEDGGGKAVYNSFGMLVAGKEEANTRS